MSSSDTFTPMARTQALLETHLPRDLALITHNYIMPTTSFDQHVYGREVGQLGHWELAILSNDWLRVAVGACYGGNALLAVFAIDHGLNMPNTILEAACYAGHPGLINLAIESGANIWNRGLSGECCGKRLEIVDMMITRGAYACSYCGRSARTHFQKN